MFEEFSHFFQESTSKKEAHRIEKFLRENDFKEIPITDRERRRGVVHKGTIKTDIISPDGKPIRLNLVIDNQMNGRGGQSSPCIYIEKDENGKPTSGTIYIQERYLKRKPGISNGIIKHEEGHFAVRLDSARFINDFEEAREHIHQSDKTFKDHDMNPEEYVVDKYGAQHNKYGKKGMVKTLRALLYTDRDMIRSLKLRREALLKQYKTDATNKTDEEIKKEYESIRKEVSRGESTVQSLNEDIEYLNKVINGELSGFDILLGPLGILSLVDVHNIDEVKKCLDTKQKERDELKRSIPEKKKALYEAYKQYLDKRCSEEFDKKVKQIEKDLIDKYDKRIKDGDAGIKHRLKYIEKYVNESWFNEIFDDIYQESNTPDRTNAVYTKSGNITKIDNVDFDKVYFGSPTNYGNHMDLDGPLFVSPYPGIASIFSVRPQKDALENKYKLPVEKITNRGYTEWDRSLISTKLKKPLKELHVLLEGDLDFEPITDTVTGYLHEIELTPELKDHIYQSDRMSREFEYCIDKIDSVKFSKTIPVTIKMTIQPESGKVTQEAKLPIGKRNKLDDSDFGIPETRSYPLHDKSHVEAAVRMFANAPLKYRKELAKRILRKAHELDMDTSNWDSINGYVQEDAMIYWYNPDDPDEIIMEAVTKKQKRRVEKFLKENNFREEGTTDEDRKRGIRRGTIETDMVDKDGKKVRVKFVLTPHATAEGSPAKTYVNKGDDEKDPSKYTIQMQEKLLRRKPDISNFVFKHEEGHIALETDQDGKYIFELDKIEKKLKELISSSNMSISDIAEHGHSKDEYFADKYGNEHNRHRKDSNKAMGFNRALLTFLSTDTVEKKELANQLKRDIERNGKIQFNNEMFKYMKKWIQSLEDRLERESKYLSKLRTGVYDLKKKKLEEIKYTEERETEFIQHHKAHIEKLEKILASNERMFERAKNEYRDITWLKDGKKMAYENAKRECQDLCKMTAEVRQVLNKAKKRLPEMIQNKPNEIQRVINSWDKIISDEIKLINEETAIIERLQERLDKIYSMLKTGNYDRSEELVDSYYDLAKSDVEQFISKMKQEHMVSVIKQDNEIFARILMLMPEDKLNKLKTEIENAKRDSN